MYTDLSTTDVDGRRRWVYPTIVDGAWWKRRKIVAWGLILFLFVIPWTRVGGQQTIHLDLFNARIHFFGMTFWANESVVVLGFILSFMAIVLLVTAVAGRIFCGWVCPMTVFMEFVYRPIERVLEGVGNVQKKFHQLPLIKRLPRSALKLGIFALISLLIANTMIAYVFGQESVLRMIADGPFVHWGSFLGMLFIFVLVFFQFTWFREQMCTFVCPYGRLQSLLLDKDSLIVAYDKIRGEPRGKPSQVTGDCVDCKMCIQVCPTGIDIREGLQLECIHCTACVDACDHVMKKLDRPLGLIRYQSENQVEGKKRKLLRPRLAIYTAMLLFASSLMLGFGGQRELIHATVHRESSSTLFSETSDGLIINPLRLHIRNRAEKSLRLKLQVVSPEGADVIVPQGDLLLEPGEKKTLHFISRVPRESFKNQNGKIDLQLELVSDSLPQALSVGTQVFGPLVY